MLYARLFYLLNILFNFLKGYIMSKTTNALIIDFLDFKISMLKDEVSVCNEMRSVLIKRDQEEMEMQMQIQNPQVSITGDIQPEVNAAVENAQEPSIQETIEEAQKTINGDIEKAEQFEKNLTTSEDKPISSACSLPHFVS